MRFGGGVAGFAGGGAASLWRSSIDVALRTSDSGRSLTNAPGRSSPNAPTTPTDREQSPGRDGSPKSVAAAIAGSFQRAGGSFVGEVPTVAAGSGRSREGKGVGFVLPAQASGSGVPSPVGAGPAPPAASPMGATGRSYGADAFSFRSLSRAMMSSRAKRMTSKDLADANMVKLRAVLDQLRSINAAVRHPPVSVLDAPTPTAKRRIERQRMVEKPRFLEAVRDLISALRRPLPPRIVGADGEPLVSGAEFVWEFTRAIVDVLVKRLAASRSGQGHEPEHSIAAWKGASTHRILSDAFDTDEEGNGVKRAEFTYVCGRLRPALKPLDLAAWFEAIDGDCDGAISLPDFLAAACDGTLDVRTLPGSPSPRRVQIPSPRLWSRPPSAFAGSPTAPLSPFAPFPPPPPPSQSPRPPPTPPPVTVSAPAPAAPEAGEGLGPVGEEGPEGAAAGAGPRGSLHAWEPEATRPSMVPERAISPLVGSGGVFTPRPMEGVASVEVATRRHVEALACNRSPSPVVPALNVYALGISRLRPQSAGPALPPAAGAAAGGTAGRAAWPAGVPVREYVDRAVGSAQVAFAASLRPRPPSAPARPRKRPASSRRR